MPKLPPVVVDLDRETLAWLETTAHERGETAAATAASLLREIARDDAAAGP